MYKVVKKQIRPNIDIPFYFEIAQYSEECISYLKNKFPTEKITATSEISEDKLTLTTTVICKKREDLLDYISDSYVYTNILYPSDEYNFFNKIKTVSVVSEKKE